jgi:NADH-quinone oxidoreductase subunit L
VGAYQASIFHLLTHAFFKALLFLGAGSVIHAMSDEQDIRRMGGIWKKIPLTYAVMWIGSLALAGVPPFAGFYSKDAILEAAWASGSAIGHYGFWCGLFVAFLTAFYSWRLLILTFHGRTRADHHTYEHVHESPAVMTVPLILLAVGAVTIGWVFHEQLLGAEWTEFWGASIVNGPENHVLHAMHEVPHWVGLAPTILGIVGIAVAYLFYVAMPSVPALLANAFRPIYLFVLNKWYFDELYNAVIVRPLVALARILWQTGDATIIDGVPNGLAALTTDGSGRASRLQTGSIAVYAFSMLIGLVVLVTVFLITR